jgi:peptide chain release factor 2
LRDAQTVRQRLDDAAILLGLAEEQGAVDTFAEVAAEVAELTEAVAERRIRALLTGRYDRRSAVVVIRAGSAEDPDSTDFAGLVLQMIIGWARRRGHRTELQDHVGGERAGIRSAVLMVAGPYAYGMLSAETGQHRLTRVSPFEPDHRRRTSVATVEVAPLAEADDRLALRDEDLRVDLYCTRAPDRAGAHSSALRLTHLPTGTTATCQSDRNPWGLRESALRVLRSRLLVPPDPAPDEVRNYTTGPQPMVWDPRSGHRTADVDRVLMGDLDAFIAAELDRRVRGGRDHQP